jgi:hypothetical protein
MIRFGCRVALLVMPFGLGGLGCGQTSFPEDGSSDAGVCPEGIVANMPNDQHQHLPIGTPITYPSNPPAGGPHWPVWARWGVHDTPVPLEYLVHNEEHGGIILFYNCPDGCPDLVTQLTAVLNSQPQDPLCTLEGTGVQTRMVLTPDPLLDVPWAAAAWGWTYKELSTCVDTASLQAFINSHYDQGSEKLCWQGGFD